MTPIPRVLERALREPERMAVAVSGGVDSVTLAVAAHRLRPNAVEVFHAVSPAVPPEATQRVCRTAKAEGWTLHIINAGEFSDSIYLSNPLDRCFACKTHLYGAIVSRTHAIVVSGTNTDDLGDFRPGLSAADSFGVRHPYVQAGIGKSGVRALARRLDLGDIADLPAAPCLASRVETGIAIDPRTLIAVNRVERTLRKMLQPRSVRCRVRTRGIVIELDAQTLAVLNDQASGQVRERVRQLWPDPDATVTIEPYVQGSAFIAL